MITNLYRIYFAVFVLTFCMHGFVCAQDIHYSQVLNSPLNLNPAETGDFIGQLRLVTNHKQQWNSFENAYSTFSLSADKSFDKYKIFNIKPSVGLLLNNDVAGDGKFGTFEAIAFFSAQLKFSNHLFAFGIAPEFTHHRINFNSLNFGSQYINDQFTPGQFHNENFTRNQFSYFDLTAGFQYQYLFSDSVYIECGLSLDHIANPSKSFFSEYYLKLPKRWQFFFNTTLKLEKNIFISPIVYYSRQGVYTEIVVGGTFDFNFNSLGLQKLYFGSYLRAKDAGILLIGVKYSDLQFNLSYDINFSKLRTISHGRGGVELSLVFILKRTKILPVKVERKCPDFI